MERRWDGNRRDYDTLAGRRYAGVSRGNAERRTGFIVRRETALSSEARYQDLPKTGTGRRQLTLTDATDSTQLREQNLLQQLTKNNIRKRDTLETEICWQPPGAC